VHGGLARSENVVPVWQASGVGMIMMVRRLTAEQAEALEADPSAAAEFIEQADSVLDLDKAWHGIHYLLTGTSWDIPPGAGEAVLGGDPIGADWGYGPPRLLRPDRVQAVAAALRDVTADSLRARFDPAVLREADVYPQVWDGDEDFDIYLLPHFLTLQAFYLEAAEQKEAVLLTIT
jgi:hypothetical protein